MCSLDQTREAFSSVSKTNKNNHELDWVWQESLTSLKPDLCQDISGGFASRRRFVIARLLIWVNGSFTNYMNR